ncbi:MAG: PAS domain S-box protein [Ferruginibacter sp.]
MTSEYLSLKILIIDDDEDDFFITSEYIKNISGNKFEVEWCYEYNEAVKLICNGQHQLYFVDYFLGAKTGLDLIKEAVALKCEQPFILLTGIGNQKIDIEAMKAGAVDYLIKSEMDNEKLERCIRYSYERSKSLKALKANERKFRNIFEHSADAVFLANEEMMFRDINDATTKLLGYSREELFSLSLFELLSGTDSVNELKDQLAITREVEDKEIILKTQTGDLKYCILSLSAEEQEEGKYYQGIIHDITALKKAEKATLRTEKRGVADRLVHVLAHEVRNPLNNINLSLEQLMPEMENTDSKIYIDIIHRNSKRIEALITELLSTSRPAEIIQVSVPLQEVIDESIAAATDRLMLKKISLYKDFPGERIVVLADPEKLKIALLNIIINAIEAMEPETGRLNVFLKNYGENSQLIIEDNGCGISDENLSRLFEPYFTAKRNGMGLGLAATLNILQSHQAEVEVKSILNEGSSFIITFKNNAMAQMEN